MSDVSTIWSRIADNWFALSVFEWLDDDDVVATVMVDQTTWNRVISWRQKVSSLSQAQISPTQPKTTTATTTTITTTSFSQSSSPSRYGLARYRYKQQFGLTRAIYDRLISRQIPTPFTVSRFIWKEEHSLPPTSIYHVFPDLLSFQLFDNYRHGRKHQWDGRQQQIIELLSSPSLTGIHSLRIHVSFNNLKNVVLPSSLTNLSLALARRDRSLAEELPTTVFGHSLSACHFHSISLSGNLNCPLHDILHSSQQSLQHLWLGDKFHQSRSLSKLRFVSLITLKLPRDFEHDMDMNQDTSTIFDLSSVAPTLRELTYTVPLSRAVDSIRWPPNLERLKLDTNSTEQLSPSQHQSRSLCYLNNRLPVTLRDLTLPYSFAGLAGSWILPSSLTYVDMGEGFNASVSDVVIPVSLTRLKFGSRFNQPLSNITLPTSLTHLTLKCEDYSHSMPEWKLPSTLQTLEVAHPCHDIMTFQLPASLTHLSFGAATDPTARTKAFNQSLDPLIPKWASLSPHLRLLNLGHAFNQPIADLSLLPLSCLRELSFGDAFNQYPDGLQLPPTLEILSFGKKFCETLCYMDLPPRLHTLHCGGWYSHRLSELQGRYPSSLTHLSLTFRHHPSLLKLSHLFPRSLVTLAVAFLRPINSLPVPVLCPVSFPPLLQHLILSCSLERTLLQQLTPYLFPNTCTRVMYQHRFHTCREPDCNKSHDD